MELWKDIEGYEGSYQVSNLGKIKSLERIIIRSDNKPLTIKESIIKGSKDSKGYLQVDFKKDAKRDIKLVHRLVAQAFIPNPNNLPQVNHKDGNKTNNKVDNLEWCTCQENVRHSWEYNLCSARYGELHPNHKLTKEEVMYIKNNYIPRDKNFGMRALARKFNVSTAPIYNITSGKGWKSLDEYNNDEY